ncbi:MAG: hypothetical protein IKO28_04435 [Prevotella sp.]|nr:hypothetical protein [Prevotella sp.]
MNLVSWILLILVLALFLGVMRYIVRGGGRSDCCRGCSRDCSSCRT